MRGSLTKPLRRAFEAGLKQLLKSAEPVKMTSAMPGSVAWLVGKNEEVAAYVILFIDQKTDRFTIELAWSSEKRIPDHTGKMPGEEGNSGELRFRLSRLWQPTGFEIWYDLQYYADSPESGPHSFFTAEGPCLQRIPVKVSRALDALKRYGLPYLVRTV